MTRKTLRQIPGITPVQIRIVRAIIGAKTPTELKAVQARYLSATLDLLPPALLRDCKLLLCNMVLELFGVECIRLSEEDKRYWIFDDVIAEYCNTGDTYCPTLVYRYDIVKRWDVLSVGDLVEILERKHYKLA